MPFAATWMHLEILILSEISQKEKDKYLMMSLIHGREDRAQMNLSTEQKQTHKHGEQICGCQGGGRGVGSTGNLELIDANYCLWNG